MKNHSLLRSILVQENAQYELSSYTDRFGNKAVHLAAYVDDPQIFEILAELGGQDNSDFLWQRYEKPSDICDIFSCKNYKSADISKTSQGVQKQSRSAYNTDRSQEQSVRPLKDEEVAKRKKTNRMHHSQQKNLISVKTKHKRHEQPKQNQLKLPIIMPNQDKYKGFGSTADLIDYKSIKEISDRMDRLFDPNFRKDKLKTILSNDIEAQYAPIQEQDSVYFDKSMEQSIQ
ncbi:UNKNOWN [Stylonychia lemnae]|uniref:Ankyrin repeat-containing protein n=1 Tax=Stylonychia lemnae TaxID=5949 RepID=A0A077ZXZ3_STYLE|nr:UNKNOWN [Stylonychia lemnae]|eukprot:CDW74472.1 UNKNOWN [Stylonychia lemnae]